MLAHLFHPRESNNFRPRVLHPEAMAVIVLTLVGIVLASQVLLRFVHPLGLVLGYASNINVSQVVAQTNQERQLASLPALVYNATLAQAAQAKAADMFENQYWAHQSPAGKEPWDFIESSGYKYQVAGENLARDFSNTNDLVQAWMDSPTHRANIVNPKYQEIGIAVVDGVLNGVETTLVVQMFGSQAVAQPALAAAPAAKAVSLTQDEAGWQVFTAQAKGTSSAEQPLALANTTSTAVLAQEVSRNLVEPWWLVAHSPKQIIKAIFLSLILILIITLVYDLYAIRHHQSDRTVGKNLAHIIFLGMIGFVVILYKSGTIG